MRRWLGVIVCLLAFCAAAPAAAEAPFPETLYLDASGSRSVSVVWSLHNRGRVSIGVACGGRDWYLADGPFVNHANNWRLRHRGPIPGAPGARKRKDGTTERVPAPRPARLRMRGYWPTRERARIFVRHSVCFPRGRRITLRSQALD